jgi:hypothetical protein
LFAFQAFLVLLGVISMAVPLDVYREVATTTGYLNQVEKHDELERTLKELRRELDFSVVDTFDHDNNPPRYKGCEPLIVSFHPVKCDVNNTGD